MKKIISITVSVFFLLILITDLHYKYIIREAIDVPKFTLILKIIIGIILTVFVIFINPVQKYFKSYLCIAALIICVSISNYFSYNSGASINQAVYIQVQYLFGLVVILFFLSNFTIIDFSYFKRVLEVLIFLNFLFIFIGYYTDYNMFRTYVTRFGYNGVFKSTSEASYFYVFAFIFYLISSQSVKRYILLTLISVSSIMVGSKTLYFFMLAAFVFHVFLALKQNFRLKNSFLFSLSIGTLIVTGFFTMKFVLPLNQKLYLLYQEEGFITLFFSLRDKLALHALEIVQNQFGLINYFFGGLAYVPKITEIAIIDLFLTFGAVGTAMFLYFLKLNFPKLRNFNLKILGSIVLASIVLRGNFFYFPSVIYLSLAIFAMILKESNKNIILTEHETNSL